jgi:hypothetical protein
MLTARTSRRPTAATRSIRVVLAGLLLAAVLPLPATAATRAYTVDLGARGDYVAQTNFVQCVGASMQMMINMVAPRDDRTAATQLRLQDLARDLSGPRPVGRERQGASVRGWTAGLNLRGAGPYRLVGATTLEEAALTAARAIRQTGRPVGLLMWRGRHAWVMSGFRATGDPLVPGSRVTAVIVEDPLYPHGSSTWGPSPAPGEALTLAELGRQYVPRRTSSQFSRLDPTSPYSNPIMSALSGKYVLVLPYRLDPRTLRHA